MPRIDANHVVDELIYLGIEGCDEGPAGLILCCEDFVGWEVAYNLTNIPVGFGNYVTSGTVLVTNPDGDCYEFHIYKDELVEA